MTIFFHKVYNYGAMNFFSQAQLRTLQPFVSDETWVGFSDSEPAAHFWTFIDTWALEPRSVSFHL